MLRNLRYKLLDLYIKLPNNLNTIREYAFAGCPLLESIDIPDNIKSLDKRAFWGSSIKSIRLPRNVIITTFNIFEQCESLQKILIPYGTREQYEQMIYIKNVLNKVALIEK